MNSKLFSQQNMQISVYDNGAEYGCKFIMRVPVPVLESNQLTRVERGSFRVRLGVCQHSQTDSE